MVVSVGEAAERLGVSTRRVRELIVAGQLAATNVSGRHAIDEVSLEALSGRVRHRAVRAFSRRIAWSAAALVDGARPGWISQPELSRLRARVSGADDDVDAWRVRMRMRAGSTARYRVGRAHVSTLLDDARVARSEVSATNLVTDRRVNVDGAEVWVATSAERAALVKAFGMLATGQGNLTVRCVDVAGLDRIGDGGNAFRLIVAADLLDGEDARTRRAGARLLGAALAERRWE